MHTMRSYGVTRPDSQLLKLLSENLLIHLATVISRGDGETGDGAALAEHLLLEIAGAEATKTAIVQRRSWQAVQNGTGGVVRSVLYSIGTIQTEPLLLVSDLLVFRPS